MALALNSKNLTIALITRNEMAAVSKVIGSIRQAVPEAEILIVDSSTDRTAEIAQELGTRSSNSFRPAATDRPWTWRWISGRPGRGHPRLRRYLPRRTDPTPRPPGPRRWVLTSWTARGWRRSPGPCPGSITWATTVSHCWHRYCLLHRVKDLHSGIEAYRKSLIDELKYQPVGAALPVELLLRPIKMRG